MTKSADGATTTCVLGLGLIGGSLLRAAAPLGTVYGWSRSEDTRAAAEAAGFDVLAELDETLERALEDDALVVLATPVDVFGRILPRIEAVAPNILLTDVASVKSVVVDQVAALAPSVRFVGSHPMAGTAHSGWSAGSATLFQDAAWVTCLDEETEVADWLRVARLGLGVGSRVVPVEPAAHDSAVARVSHLPHILALALAQVGVGGGDLSLALAASSFADGTRVAATRPELIRAMCENNRQALISALDEALGIIGVARGSLASTGSLVKITEAGHLGRQSYDQRHSGLVPVELSGDDLVEQLVSVGAAGGFVTSIDGPDDDPVVHGMYPDFIDEV